MLMASTGNGRDAACMKRILVVEDDEAMCKHLQELLVHFGFEVRSASDGTAGLNVLKAWPPDLVILDVFLPQKDGFEMLLELRRDHPRLKVLVMTGKEHLIFGKSIKFAEQLGANCTLTKPFTTKELETCIKAMAPVVAV